MADSVANPVALDNVNGASIEPVVKTPNVPVENAAAPTPAVTAPRPPRGPSKFQMMNSRYALPAPLRTFPLPTFVPHNPLSLLQILYIWVSQTISPQSSAFDPLYQGWFSAETRSVHVTDPRSIKALWDQGFYGKGSLSRSEPNWLKAEKEKQARGSSKAKTSEELTRKRRRERQQVKWERARLQKEAIDQKLLEEAEAANSPDIAINGNPLPVEISFNVSAVDSPPELSTSDDASDVSTPTPTPRGFVSPVGPLELLQLPNSEAELASFFNGTKALVTPIHVSSHSPKFNGLLRICLAPVGPLQLLALPNSALDMTALDIEEPTLQLESSIQATIADGVMVGDVISEDIHTNGNGSIHPNGLHLNGYTKSENTASASVTSDEISTASTHTEDTTIDSPMIDFTRRIKRQKSVRFSPTVQQTTFIQFSPPRPEYVAERVEAPAPIKLVEAKPSVIKDQEHTQLTLEEAFFLSYSLGALTILDPETRTPMSNLNLLSLFRRTSYFPPLAPGNFLAPDDPFMLNYKVYHHYRSLGWCVRSGIKFSVDFMLYTRGPPFSHAEFAVVILPSYSDPYWANDEGAKLKERRTWAWMSCINRVITQVKKTVLLVYVDIPPPITAKQEGELGISGVIARYKLREFVMKRWVSNRHRST